MNSSIMKSQKEDKMIYTRGLILLESLPSLFIASRMQAKSTTAGTPVKSWEKKGEMAQGTMQIT